MPDKIFALHRELELAKEASRALDGDIAQELGLFPQEKRWVRMLPELTGGTVRQPYHWYVPAKDWNANEKWPAWYVPHFTKRIDDAILLVPEKFEWLVSDRASDPHKGRAYIHNKELHFSGITLSGPSGPAQNPKYIGCEVTAATPALALCIVCIQARILMMGSKN